MKLFEKIKIWYKGKYVPPPGNVPESSVVFISPGHYEKSFLAQSIEKIIIFWKNHWKFLITLFLMIVSIVLAIVQS